MSDRDEDDRQHGPLDPASGSVEAGTAVASKKKGRPQNQEAIVWNDTARSLADKIIREYLEGKIQATSPMDALTQACERYVRKNGTHFSARSLWQNLKNREADGKAPAIPSQR
jgi:hypothetical protein